MSVISIRLNKKEEKILTYLTNHFNEEKSSLIKHSLIDMYENIQDIEEVKIFERKEKEGKTSFITFDEVTKDL